MKRECGAAAKLGYTIAGILCCAFAADSPGLMAAELNAAVLQREVNEIAARCDGRMGIGVRLGELTVAVRGDERFALQSVMKLIVGLQWRHEFVDADVLQRAIDSVPESARDAAFERGLRDERDTATPRGMVDFLYALTSGTLLPREGTERLFAIMRNTSTFPDRLKAGAPADWVLGHKTGTSNTWKGVTAVTTDVGFLVTPDGAIIQVAVFVAESRLSSSERATLIADVARAVVRNYR